MKTVQKLSWYRNQIRHVFHRFKRKLTRDVATFFITDCILSFLANKREREVGHNKQTDLSRFWVRGHGK